MHPLTVLCGLPMGFYGDSMWWASFPLLGKTKKAALTTAGCSTPAMASGRPLAHLRVWYQVQTENIQSLVSIWLPAIPLG